MQANDPEKDAPAGPTAGGAPDGVAPPALPEVVLARQNRLHMSLVWLVPVVALVIGAVLVVRAVMQTGPELTIEFRSAEGIEPGRTQVRFKEVVVGLVKQVKIAPDRQKVRATVALDKSVASIAVDDTRFWVVRPRIGTSGVSGLGTLLSGAYIAVDAGASEETRTDFVGLDTPPLVLRGEPGRSFVLRTEDLGSLDVGSPVYHRRIRVGRVVGYGLDRSGKALEVQVFIESPNEALVTSQSRFWHASGVDLALNASGLTLNTQSVASVLAGGLAFGTPAGTEPGPGAPAGTLFELHATQRAALAPPDGEPLRVRMVFKQSMRGMEEGAPIDLLGVEIGVVRRVTLLPGGSDEHLPVEVLADVYPLRLGSLRERLAGPARPGTAQGDRALLAGLVARGLRAQVRTGNLLTGRLYVALDFVPKAPAVPFDAGATVPTLPTVPGTLADLQPQVAEIVARLSKVRFDEIGSDLQDVLKTASAVSNKLQSTLGSAETTIREIGPDVQRTLAELRATLDTAGQALGSAERSLLDTQAPLQRSTAATLAEVQRAAQALRVLSEYLQRHPETLLRGKPPDELPRAASEPAR